MIKFFREEGFILCNMTDGGDGTTGYKRSKELNEAVASKNRGLKRSKESISRISKAHLNYTGDVLIKMTSGREGKGNPAYKGNIVATSLLDNSTIELCGVKEIRLAGFDDTRVYNCIAGKYKQHKGYTFKRKNEE